MKHFSGNGCADGYVKSEVLKKKTAAVSLAETAKDAQEELRLFEDGMVKLENRLEELYHKTLMESGEEAAELIETYQVILCDRQFFDQIRERIQQEKLSGCMAIQAECDACEKLFAEMEDAYMRERFEDIRAVCNELLSVLGDGPGALSEVVIDRPVVIVADTLTPVDTVKMDKEYLRGFVTETGGETSHAVILARALGIPAVTGAAGIMEAAQDCMEILLNGTDGDVVLEPDAGTKKEFECKMQKAAEESLRFEKEPPGEVYTRDGQRVRLAVNASDAAPIQGLDLCDGIGLFRTEFLYMQQEDYPSEELLYQTYQEAVRQAGKREVVFRTLDIGGDKALGYMGLPEEENPFLGYRAVRICLDRPDMFKTQLRAILRVSRGGNVKIMFPMISSLEELLYCREMLESCKKELHLEGVDCREDVPAGIMVETPSAVMILDQLAPCADFFSVGTNDLTQYFMAADRGNPAVHKLYDPFYPAVLRALHHIGSTAQKYHVPLSVCGEAAADIAMIPFLLGCSVEKLSIAEPMLPKVRYLVRRIHKGECTELARQIIQMQSVEEIKERLREYAENTLKRGE